MVNMGLSGAHRVGKSTLAKAVAERQGWTYVPSRVTEIYTGMGIRVGERVPVDQRLKVQQAILDAHLEDVAAVQGPWISDRTTLDFATYMLMAGMDDPAHEKEIAEYVERCCAASSRLYSSIILVQPGIAPVIEEGKFPPNVVTQELMNFTLWGLMADPRVNTTTMFLRRECLSLEERVETVCNLHSVMLVNASVAREGAVIH